eukprot:scaffold5121_cov40-Cyclotella_meneghiniana.AAC.1
MVTTRHNRYSTSASIASDAPAAPNDGRIAGRATDSPGIGSIVDDDGDVLFGTKTHSAERLLEDGVAALIAGEFNDEQGDNVSDPGEDGVSPGEDLYAALSSAAGETQPTDTCAASVVDDDDGGGKMSSGQQRFAAELELNYSRLRSEHDFEQLDSSLHWCIWANIPHRARIIISNECYRASLSGSVDIHHSSISALEEIESTDTLYWLCGCLNEMVNYYADRVASKKSKRDSAIDVDEISSSSSSSERNEIPPTVKDEPQPKIESMPFIHHPNHSKYYSFVFVVAKCISDILDNFDVCADGSCGYHGVVGAVRHYIKTFPEDTDRFFNIGILDITADHEGMILLRSRLHDFIEERYNLFLSDDTCPILDWCDEVLNNRYYFVSDKKNKKKSKQNIVNRIKPLIDFIFNYEIFRKLKPGQFLSDQRRWLDTGLVGPFISYWTELPVFVYNKLVSKTEKVNGRPKITETTSIFFYRPHDEKTMKVTINAVIHPFSNCLVIYYDGRNHYNWSIIKDGITRSTFNYHPEGNASGDVFVDQHGDELALGHVPSGVTLDVRSPSPPSKTDDDTRDKKKNMSAIPKASSPDGRRDGKPKKRNGNRNIVIHPLPISSPDQSKIMNEVPRKKHPLWSEDLVIDDVTSDTDELVLVRNNLYDPQVGGYLDQHWTKNLPTMHTAVCDIAMVARNAVVENSNGNNEGRFKHSKHDKTHIMACKDPATYLHYYAMQSRSQAAKMIDQLRSLQQRVDETNKRKEKAEMMKVIKESMGVVDDDEVMDKLDVKWQRKPQPLNGLLDQLESVMKFHGIENLQDQFEALDESAKRVGTTFITKKTFKKWMDPATRGQRKNSKQAAWSVIRDFIKQHPTGEDNEDVTEPTNQPEDEITKLPVPALPPIGSSDNYNKITDSDISKVMDDNPTPDDGIGELVSGIRRLRGEYSLITDHSRTFIPERITRFVEKFIKDVLDSEEYANSWICEDDTIVKNLMLRDYEMMGTTTEYKGCPKPTLVDGRKIIGVNIPENEPAWHNRYSVSLADLPMDEIFHRMYGKIPESLFPKKGESPECLGDRIAQSKYIDVIYSWFDAKSPRPLNENTSSMQPIRRTTGMVKRRPFYFHTQLPPGEEEGDGKSVVTLYGYPNPECPTNLWMCFAQNKLEYAQGLKVWTKAWPALSSESRRCPPNGCQFLMYHRRFNRKMGKHRDNNRGNVILNLVNGSKMPWGENSRVGGSENSQVRGSSVMIFSRGRPMTLTLSYASPEREVTQQSKYYITSPSFQMRMEDGWITVLDMIDDTLMVHSVDWPEDDESGSDDETDVRMAWVYRWLCVTHDYYTLGCTVRRTKEMMKTCERIVDNAGDYLDREMV